MTIFPRRIPVAWAPALADCLRADRHAVVAPDHFVTRDRIQRGRTERLAGAQIEAGMMPGTAHGLARRRGLPRAVRSSESTSRRAHETVDPLRTRMTAAPFACPSSGMFSGESGYLDSRRQVGSGELGRVSHHFTPGSSAIRALLMVRMVRMFPVTTVPISFGGCPSLSRASRPGFSVSS